MLDAIQVMATKAAVNKMMQDGYLSICTIDNILKMTGGIPNRKDYDLLHMLHCVKFMDMDPELLRGLPVILQRVIAAEEIVIEFTPNVKLRLIQ
jgi:hypothetical protein